MIVIRLNSTGLGVMLPERSQKDFEKGVVYMTHHVVTPHEEVIFQMHSSKRAYSEPMYKGSSGNFFPLERRMARGNM